MSFTVVPLHNLTLPAGLHIPFGDGFVLQDLPECIRSDRCLFSDLSRHDRQSTLDAKHALVTEYQDN
jgi:hypothetical protein